MVSAASWQWIHWHVNLRSTLVYNLKSVENLALSWVPICGTACITNTVHYISFYIQQNSSYLIRKKCDAHLNPSSLTSVLSCDFLITKSWDPVLCKNSVVIFPVGCYLWDYNYIQACLLDLMMQLLLHGQLYKENILKGNLFIKLNSPAVQAAVRCAYSK